jgi:hypothetical protein
VPGTRVRLRHKCGVAGRRIGLVLFIDKNDAVVCYMQPESDRQIFANCYRLDLPSDGQLREEIQRELDLLAIQELAE